MVTAMRPALAACVARRLTSIGSLRRYSESMTSSSVHHLSSSLVNNPQTALHLYSLGTISKLPATSRGARWSSASVDVNFGSTSTLSDANDLTEGLNAEDEQMINQLLKYQQRHGDCHVPTGSSVFAVAERNRLGVSGGLFEWVRNQRQKYQIIMKNDETQRRTKKVKEADRVLLLVLETMGFMWSEREAQWQRAFNRLEAHKARYDTLEVDRGQDPQTWTWMDQQRKAYSKDRLPEERFTLLEELGFVFDLHEAAWWQNYDKLCEYVEQSGDAKPPTQNDDDPSFGTWIARQRHLYQLDQISEDRIEALESVGFSWNIHGETWEQFYHELVSFYRENGHTRVPTSDGPLWFWVDRQRRQLRRLAKDEQVADDKQHKIASLNKVEFDWEDDTEGRVKRLMDLPFAVAVHDERWVDNYNSVCAFKEQFGHFLIPNDEKYQELSTWVKHQRFLNKRSRLLDERVAALDEIGFAWTAQVARWDIMYECLIRFQAEHGHTRVPTRNAELYRWINEQRKALRDFSEAGEKARSSKADARLMALEKILEEY